MEFDENIYDKIDKYLSNEMEGEELAAFEKEKNSNKALAEEVEINAQMKTFLADTPENDLRKNLFDLGNQYEEKEEDEKIPIPISKGNSFKYLLQVAAVILMAAMAWWVYNQSTSKVKNDDPQIVDTPPTLQNPKENPIDDPKETPIDNSAPKNIVKDNNTIPPKNDVPKIETPPSQNKKPDLYAANFEPNSSLEFLIENNLRDGAFEMVVRKKIGNISLSSLEDIVEFQFSGGMVTRQELLKKDFKIHLFSNSKTEYEDFLPISSNDLKLVQLEEDGYDFDFQKSFILKPGVYYYLLEDVELEKIYYVNKFEVRLQ